MKHFVLETTGQTTGYLLDSKYSEGTSGSKYFDGSAGYETASVTVGDTSVVRPVVDEKRVYTQAITTGTTGSYLTTYTLAWYSGTGEELMVELRTTNQPIISTANNGSNATENIRQRINKQGRMDWEQRPDLVLNYKEYTYGQVSKSIRDVDEDDSTDFPSGSIAPTGWNSDASAVHQRVTATFDAQGRAEEQTRADGRVTKVYTSKLADGRRINLRYPKYVSGSGTYYGPVPFSVSNQAGNTEEQGVIGLSTTTTALASHVD